MRWINYGKRHRPCDCDNAARVKFSMDPFIDRFQPHLYQKWIQHLDIGPHPEDTPERIREIEERAKNPSKYARKMELETMKRLSGPNLLRIAKPHEKVVDVYQHVDYRYSFCFIICQEMCFLDASEILLLLSKNTNVE